MDIVKTAKEMGFNVEKGVETITNKLVNTFDNLASHLPFSNIARKENSSFHLEVDLPGVTKEDIDIKVEDGILAISAIRKYKNELTRDDYYICESSFGKFERRYALPESVDTSKVDAKLVDGRLIVELQKTKKAQPRVISIK